MDGTESNSTCEGILCCDWILLLKGDFNSKIPCQHDNLQINNNLKASHNPLQKYIQKHNKPDYS